MFADEFECYIIEGVKGSKVLSLKDGVGGIRSWVLGMLSMKKSIRDLSRDVSGSWIQSLECSNGGLTGDRNLGTINLGDT